MIQKETCLQKKACRQVSSFAISLCIKQNQMRMHQCVGSAPGCCLATTPLSSAYSTQQSGSWSMLTILKKCTPHSRYFSDELGVQKI